MLGIWLAIYCLYAVGKGEVFARSGRWGSTISRAGSPRYFFLVITIYILLSFALIAVF